MWWIVASLYIDGALIESHRLSMLGDVTPMSTLSECVERQHYLQSLIEVKEPATTFERTAYDTLTVYHEGKRIDLTCKDK